MARSMLTEKQEMFAQLVARGVYGVEAMRKAGYSEKTIDKIGAPKLLANEKVKNRVEQLQEKQLGGVIDGVRSELLRLRVLLGKALDTLTELMENGESESVRYRAAAEILNASKGILVASIPKKHAHFHIAMRDLYNQAKAIDIDADPN